MEKNELIAWENKCIQEESPECTSACPLHVDARLFLKEIRKGDRDAAYKVLNKTMPFPGILGRICDHPCEERCKRGQVGGPIAIGSLERLCVEKYAGKKRVQLLPRKNHRIAVLGAGLAGVTAAWDLLKKGFVVSVFESGDRLGGPLWDLPEQMLPREVIEEELSVLETMMADIHLGVRLDRSFFEQACEEYEAVILDRDSFHGCDLSLELDDDGLIAVTPSTGATNREGVFAGGGTRLRGKFSPVMETLEGRKPALSIERLMQKVGLEFGRENEGPCSSRLFTSLEGIDPLPRVVATDSAKGYSEEEALREAERCIQCECMECVKKCLFLERYKAYPKKYAREIFNNERILLGAAHQYNVFTNSCSTCGLCETICPNDFSMADMCLEARRTLLKQKIMPPSFHEFALDDMAFSNGEPFTLCRHEPGKTESAWLYFPSCQLCGSAPGEVLLSYRYLREKLDGGVGILLRCCGAPAHWAGRDDLFKEALDGIRASWEKMGKPRIITACTTCHNIFQEHLPETEPVSLWHTILEVGMPGTACAHGADGNTVAVVDPCASRHNPVEQKSIRWIIESLGMHIEELPLSGEMPECCGYGGLMYNANPTLARDVVARRTTASDNDYLAYCAMCRDNFAFAGKRVSHLIEHLFPSVEGADPAARGWISWSDRRVNRGRVKELILRDLGEREEAQVAEYDKLKLTMSSDVLKRIDERRILEEDIRKVIFHGETSGKKMRSRESGNFLAYLQPENVTFWVEYSPHDDGFEVLNAYCHRMKIVGIMK
ncbi:MAG: heterodisulfide reductase-related iron-sulfur binding cluster [Geobacteraceae bacterium]|nr:heterodisulfide reductase-related iron-sulfur binding cluster [Geobacteraceae bacterium]